MKTTILIVLSSVMAIGAYTLLQASARERDKEAEQAVKVEHCKQVIEQVIRESDEVIAKGKFPTQDQQDNWRQMSEPCREKKA